MADDAIRAALQAWVDRAEPDPRVKALWLEGPTPAGLRAPVPPLDLHVGVEEPDFAGFVAGFAVFLGAAGAATIEAQGPVEPEAWMCRAQVAGVGPVTLTVERMNLISKRARAAVSPRFDRTGRLRFVLDYGKGRAPTAPPATAAPAGALPDSAPRAPAPPTGWRREGETLVAIFARPSYLSAVRLAAEGALAGADAGREPELAVRGRRVSFVLPADAARAAVAIAAVASAAPPARTPSSWPGGPVA